MIISKKRFELQLHERWLDGMLTGKNEVLDLIRDSEKVVIVHGDFKVKDSAAVKNSAIFVVPKNIGINIEKNSKKVTISDNIIQHKQ